jgi:hypothetical protein
LIPIEPVSSYFSFLFYYKSFLEGTIEKINTSDAVLHHSDVFANIINQYLLNKNLNINNVNALSIFFYYNIDH